MEQNSSESSNGYDIAVIGSGFGGSITAMGLNHLGYKVCMIEKGSHPRFAIGESSTPIADMILRDLADDYQLPFLKEISRYGEWQKHHPDIKCGLKRGFSYYHHKRGKSFVTDAHHQHELLVAASVDDHNSDTNWFRSDVDHFLFKKAHDLGVDIFENSEILELDRSQSRKMWTVTRTSGKQRIKLKTRLIIDATGSAHFSEKFFNNSSVVSEFKTNSEAIFTHFQGVPTWIDYLKEQQISTSDYPYTPDDSALHHIIDEGWVWMLRFNDGLLSCGLVLDKNGEMSSNRNIDPKEQWGRVLKQYPSIHQILKNGIHSEQPGKFIYSGRLQRKLNQTFGEGWIALNHTVGFVDPMHSTGIAFSLCGIERLLHLIKNNTITGLDKSSLTILQDKTHKELEFIDILVSMTYLSRWNSELFNAAVMIYFVASVQYEQARLRGDNPEMFLNACNRNLTRLALNFHDDMAAISVHKNMKQVKELVGKITESIEPYNDVGLLDDTKLNMYRHTAVVL